MQIMLASPYQQLHFFHIHKKIGRYKNWETVNSLLKLKHNIEQKKCSESLDKLLKVMKVTEEIEV